MENVYYNAYTEVYEILSYMPISYIKKIPKELLNIFETKRNKDYNYSVNVEKKICEQEMLVETKAILMCLYRDFWVSSNEKEKIIQNDKRERDIYQKELKEKYNSDNLFKNKETKEETVDNYVNIVEYKESVFKKIRNWFKKIFSGK